MQTTKTTKTSPVRDRATRGLALCEAGAVTELELGGLYVVRSSSDPDKSYLVFCATQDGAPARCDCQDQRRRGGRCAHLFAVAAHLVRERRLDRAQALACIAAPERSPRPVPPAPRRPLAREPRPYQGWRATDAHRHQVNALLAAAERAGQLAGLSLGREVTTVQ